MPDATMVIIWFSVGIIITLSTHYPWHVTSVMLYYRWSMTLNLQKAYIIKEP